MWCDRCRCRVRSKVLDALQHLSCEPCTRALPQTLNASCVCCTRASSIYGLGFRVEGHARIACLIAHALGRMACRCMQARLPKHSLRMHQMPRQKPQHACPQGLSILEHPHSLCLSLSLVCASTHTHCLWLAALVRCSAWSLLAVLCLQPSPRRTCMTLNSMLILQRASAPGLYLAQSLN